MGRIPDIAGRRILITGEVNTGKTTLAGELMNTLCSRGLSSRMAVIDMAPEIPEEIALRRGMKGVGGRLAPAGGEGVLYLAVPLRPPRLSAGTEEEALSIAAENRELIDGLFARFRTGHRDILFINDVSMYVQAGRAEDLLRWIAGTPTVVANGYYGRRLGTGVLSLREAGEMEKLIASFPFHVSLPGQSLEEVLEGR